MDLHYYQYKIGTGVLQHSEMHASLTEVFFDSEFQNDNGYFVRQIKNVLIETEINPILRKNIVRGIHLRDRKYSRIIDYITLPLKFIEKGYFNTNDVELGLIGSETTDWEGHFLNEKYYYFYETKHPFSQWHKCIFEVDNLVFNSSEQFMMYNKALLFEDIEIAEKILLSKDVKEQKALGRQVRNFDIKIWEKEAINIIFKGNKAKFSQNNEFKNLLLSTEGQTLVEASPTDVVWGIGLEEADHKAFNIRTWNGTNWLGIALTELREEFRNNSFEMGYLMPNDFNQLISRKYNIS